jgi:hypothetical protein
MAFRVRWLGGGLLPLILLLCGAMPGEARSQSVLEKKLTQRVDQIYQLFVSAEWRKVGPLLTEDSQDYWLAQPKGKVDSYHIESVEIAPNGKQATAMVKVTFQVKEGPGIPFTMIRRSNWVYQKGQWFMKLAPPSSMLQMFKSSSGPSNAVKAQSPLRFDENPIHAARPQPGTEVVVKVPYQNVTPNTITVQDLRTNCPCLKVEMDKTVVKPEEKGLLTVTYQASAETTPGRTPTVQAVLAPVMFLLDIPVLFDSEQ